jgi:hypothetical protein
MGYPYNGGNEYIQGNFIVEGINASRQERMAGMRHHDRISRWC